MSNKKARIRKEAARESARTILNSIISGNVDVYEGYRALFALYCSNNAALEEIKPMFRLNGIDPDGVFSVTAEFRTEVRQLAEQLLLLISG